MVVHIWLLVLLTEPVNSYPCTAKRLHSLVLSPSAVFGVPFLIGTCTAFESTYATPGSAIADKAQLRNIMCFTDWRTCQTP
jgi:hypothetical protein